jgi:hypothetical protein
MKNALALSRVGIKIGRMLQIAIDSLQCVTQAVPAEALEQQQQQARQQRNSILKGAERVIKGAIPDASIRGGIRVIKGATGGGIKVIQGARHGSIKVIKGAVGRLRQKNNDSSNVGRVPVPPPIRMQRRPSMQMLLNNTTVLAGKREPISSVVQASSPWVLLHEKTAPQTTRPLNRCYLSEPSYFKPFCSRVAPVGAWHAEKP